MGLSSWSHRFYICLILIIEPLHVIFSSWALSAKVFSPSFRACILFFSGQRFSVAPPDRLRLATQSFAMAVTNLPSSKLVTSCWERSTQGHSRLWLLIEPGNSDNCSSKWSTIWIRVSLVKMVLWWVVYWDLYYWNPHLISISISIWFWSLGSIFTEISAWVLIVRIHWIIWQFDYWWWFPWSARAVTTFTHSELTVSKQPEWSF